MQNENLPHVDILLTHNLFGHLLELQVNKSIDKIIEIYSKDKNDEQTVSVITWHLFKLITAPLMAYSAIKDNCANEENDIILPDVELNVTKILLEILDINSFNQYSEENIEIIKKSKYQNVLTSFFSYIDKIVNKSPAALRLLKDNGNFKDYLKVNFLQFYVLLNLIYIFENENSLDTNKIDFSCLLLK